MAARLDGTDLDLFVGLCSSGPQAAYPPCRLGFLLLAPAPTGRGSPEGELGQYDCLKKPMTGAEAKSLCRVSQV